MDPTLIADILNAAGPRRDAVIVVLYEHGILKRVNQDDTEPTGPETESEVEASPVEATEADAEVSTEAEEP